MPGAFPLDEPHHPPPNPGPYGGIPIIPIRGIRGRGMPHFRLGFAARGGLRGAGGQAGQGE